MRRGEFQAAGPLTLGDLRQLVAGANAFDYSDAALVEIRTPLPPHNRHAVTITVTDGETDSLGDPLNNPADEEQPTDETEPEGAQL